MTINVDLLIHTTSGVIKPTGDRLQFNAIFLSTNAKLPANQVWQFGTLAEVEAYFGTSSTEATLAAKYFLGWDNSTKKPAAILFWRYPLVAISAFLRGGSLATMTLTQLKALSGTLTLTVDGETKTTASIDLSGATSFSNAASLINTALDTAFTATLTCTYDAELKAFVITSGSTGASSTITYATGTLSTGIKLTSATGAVLSQGADASTPATELNAIVNVTRNWVSIVTTFEPTLDDKILFATWVNDHSQEYAYLAWDTDSNALDAQSSADLGSLLIAGDYIGTSPIYGTAIYAAAMAGMVASLDTTRPNGWATFAYKSQSGLTPNINNDTDAQTLEAKRYMFYGDWATRAQQSNFYMAGQSSGNWKWLDDYIGQIYLRDAFQTSALSLFKQLNKIPYNERGYGQLKTVWIGDVVNPALEIGVINAGINLDSTQRVTIDSLTGVDGAGDIVAANGWYLSVTDPTANARANRESPVCIFVYTSGQSIQKIELPIYNAQ